LEEAGEVGFGEHKLGQGAHKSINRKVSLIEIGIDNKFVCQIYIYFARIRSVYCIYLTW
jgi:hypothetical protein